jgi:hypothetical protein
MPKASASKKEEFDGEEKKSKNTKKSKSKRPKGASSAYNLYVADHRAALSAADPNLSFGELSKRVSADWNQLTPEQRKVRELGYRH